MTGQWLDRVAASVGSTAITERDVTMECRFENFLEGRIPQPQYNATARKKALDRLVSQVLLTQQLEGIAEANTANAGAARKALEDVSKRFSSPEDFATSLHRLGMSKAEVAQRIEAYQHTLEMIEERFHPVAPPSDAEVAKYYHATFEPEYRRLNHKAAPALKEVETQIREVLVQQDINQLLSKWLDEMRATQRVRYRHSP